MLKKLMALFISGILILSFLPVFAETDYDEEGAYRECCTLYPDFIENVKSAGATDAQLMTFVKSVEAKILEAGTVLTEENFDDLMFEAFKEAFKMRKNEKVRNALAKAYPDSVTNAMDKIITNEFMPIYITVKRFLFGIKTPLVTLSGDKEHLLVHHVNMPENTMIFVGFYSSDGTLLQAHLNPVEGVSCTAEDLCYSEAYVWEKGSLSPVCDSFKLIFEQ